jgi:hypothetical protein
MRKAVRFFVLCALLLVPAVLTAGEKFDGNWQTTLTCPDKGKTAGYTWKFPAVIKDGAFRGEHGTEGQPGYLLVEGKIADDGTAKLSASGIVASRQYARGVFVGQGTSYSYNIKAQFKETEGAGTRDEGLGIVGRPCTFDFVKQAPSQTGGR